MEHFQVKVVSLELKDDLEQALDKEVNAENQADDHDENRSELMIR